MPNIPHRAWVASYVLLTPLNTCFENILRKDKMWILCSPNEDLGRPNKLFRVRFPGRTFQGCEYCILGYKTLKSASLETRSEKFVRPSQIFVWEG